MIDDDWYGRSERVGWVGGGGLGWDAGGVIYKRINVACHVLISRSIRPFSREYIDSLRSGIMEDPMMAIVKVTQVCGLWTTDKYFVSWIQP